MDIFKQPFPGLLGFVEQTIKCLDVFLKLYFPLFASAVGLVCVLSDILNRGNKISCLGFLLPNCALLSSSLKLLCFQFQVLIARISQEEG